MPSSPLLTALGLLLSLVPATPALAREHAPAASAAARCSIGAAESRRMGPTYVTSLTASGVSCAEAKRVVKAFHVCRRARGGVKGRCRSRVRGFSCAEKRTSIRTQFSSRVICRKGGASVVHTYTQFT